MHFRHISAKIQSKNLKQDFDWGGTMDPLATPLLGQDMLEQRYGIIFQLMLKIKHS